MSSYSAITLTKAEYEELLERTGLATKYVKEIHLYPDRIELIKYVVEDGRIKMTEDSPWPVEYKEIIEVK